MKKAILILAAGLLLQLGCAQRGATAPQQGEVFEATVEDIIPRTRELSDTPYEYLLSLRRTSDGLRDAYLVGRNEAESQEIGSTVLISETYTWKVVQYRATFMDASRVLPVEEAK